MTDRPFTLGGGIGFGGLSFKDALGHTTTDSGMAYTFRLGFGLRPGLLLLWDVEGSFVNKQRNRDFADGESRGAADLRDQPAVPEGRLRSRRGRSVRHGRVPPTGAAPRWAASGYELIQGWNWSLDIEATVTGARYEYSGGTETWTNWSLVNFAINFF